jgi:hypothetical protein
VVLAHVPDAHHGYALQLFTHKTSLISDGLGKFEKRPRRYHAGANVAVTASSSSTTNVADKAASWAEPFQPAKDQPGSADAVSRTSLPGVPASATRVCSTDPRPTTVTATFA